MDPRPNLKTPTLGVCGLPTEYPPLKRMIYEPLVASFFYNTPNQYLIIIFIVLMVVISILGLLMYTKLAPKCFTDNSTNDSVNIYIGIISIYIGVSVAFIIADEWQRFRESDDEMSIEAASIGLLYDVFDTMPNTNQQRILIREYLNYIIYIEFPSLENGIIPKQAPCIIDKLSKSIYGYEPKTNREQALFSQAISLLSQSLELRTDRLRSSLSGIQQELWWVMITGVFLVIIMSWFIKASFMFKVMMTIFVAVATAILLFLAVALNYPFRGDFGLEPDAFELVLQQLPEYTGNQIVKSIPRRNNLRNMKLNRLANRKKIRRDKDNGI